MVDDQVPEKKENLPPGSLGSGIEVFVYRRIRTRASRRRLSRNVSSRPAMGNQPGVARMDTSDPDGTPSASRRKSGEASREQRTPAGIGPLSSIEHQVNLPEVRAVLSEIINCVDCEPSSETAVETSGDREDDMADRTFSPRPLSAPTEDLHCLPGQGSVDKTFVIDETPHTSLHDGEAAASVGHTQGQKNSLDNPSSSCDARTEKQLLNISLLDVTNKSELDLTYTTAKGSPLGATGFFSINSNDSSIAALVEKNEVNAPAASTINESHHQQDSLEAVPENTVEFPSVLSETSSRDVTCIAVEDTLLLPESDNVPTKASGLLNPGVINEALVPFELYDQNVNLLEPSDSRKLPDAPVSLDTNSLLCFDNCSTPSVSSGSEERRKTSNLSSKDGEPTGTGSQNETLTFSVTDSNDNLVTTKGDENTTGISVIPKSLGAAAVGSGDQACIQHSSDKDKTEGTLPVDSEAGPEVAQFSKEEFNAAAVYFKEDLGFLEKVGSSRRLGRTSLGRCSLYLAFDPLARRRSEGEFVD
ncbi:hypothetical protein HPB50_001339 [Hyalomma asiaticum]|uniref:Uncharacterized protein n=1 Tax=Hyalomma asiaticum TaxID=266040 RepID=A0ACB7TDB7_HYAAI|nr:hypothetical protein HPB50_001339 [Hyalomma asiaticum]